MTSSTGLSPSSESGNQIIHREKSCSSSSTLSSRSGNEPINLGKGIEESVGSEDHRIMMTTVERQRGVRSIYLSIYLIYLIYLSI